jgi:hypothetical protein
MLNEGGEGWLVKGRDYLAIQTSKHLSSFLKIDLQENFPALICFPVDKFSQLFSWGGNFSVDSSS